MTKKKTKKKKIVELSEREASMLLSNWPTTAVYGDHYSGYLVMTTEIVGLKRGFALASALSPAGHSGKWPRDAVAALIRVKK